MITLLIVLVQFLSRGVELVNIQLATRNVSIS